MLAPGLMFVFFGGGKLAPPSLFTATPEGGDLLLTWANGEPTAKTRIYRNSVVVETVAAGVSAHTITLQTGTYVLRHVKAGRVSVASNSQVVV